MNIAYSYIWQWHFHMESVLMLLLFILTMRHYTIYYPAASYFLRFLSIFYPTTQSSFIGLKTSPPTATCMHSHPHFSAMPPLSDHAMYSLYHKTLYYKLNIYSYNGPYLCKKTHTYTQPNKRP